jgi:hypothetical protein
LYSLIQCKVITKIVFLLIKFFQHPSEKCSHKIEKEREREKIREKKKEKEKKREKEKKKKRRRCIILRQQKPFSVKKCSSKTEINIMSLIYMVLHSSM